MRVHININSSNGNETTEKNRTHVYSVNPAIIELFTLLLVAHQHIWAERTSVASVVDCGLLITRLLARLYRIPITR